MSTATGTQEAPEQIVEEVAGQEPALPTRPSRLVAVLLAVTAMIVVASAFYLSRGEPAVGLDEVWRAIVGPLDDSIATFVIRDLRLPRLVLALVSGAALGLAGTIMQDSLRNPIADPGLLGISQAASLVVALSLLFPGVLPDVATPFLALLAGLFTGLILVLMARSIRDPVRLILIGVVLAMFYGTLTSIVTLLVPESGGNYLSQFFRFEIGSLSGASWARLAPIWPWLLVGIPAAMLCGRALNLLQLGDDVASGLGMKVTRARLILLFVAVLLVAPIVSVAGPIAFVALLAPHVARFLLGTTNAYAVLPASALIGALVVLLADTAGRLLFFPLEVPVGIWTIIVAGPLAIWLAGKKLRGSGEVMDV